MRYVICAVTGLDSAGPQGTKALASTPPHTVWHTVIGCPAVGLLPRCLQIPKPSRGSAALQLANENIVQRTLIQHSMFPCANHQFSLKGSPKAQAHQAQPEPNKVPCINVINNLAALAVLHLKCEE